MTRDEIIRMARETELIMETDCTTPWMEDHDLTPYLERFAALVAARIRETELKPDWNNYWQGVADGAASEREEIAQFLESTNLSQLPDATALHYARLLKGFAEGIRARKENT